MKLLPPIATKKQVETFNQLSEHLSPEEREAIIAWGADLVSKTFIQGAVATLGCATIPVVIFVLNRVLREHP